MLIKRASGEPNNIFFDRFGNSLFLNDDEYKII